MKTKLFILIISFFSVLSCDKKLDVGYEQEIKKTLTAFIENIKSKKIEEAALYIYPKYLDQITREHMIYALNVSYNNPALAVDVKDFKIDKIDKPEKINDEYFSMVDYSFRMKFKADWNLIPNPEILKQKIGMGLEIKYGKENVQYFSKEDYYLINAKMKACAISKDGKDWKFLIVDGNDKLELMNILPEKILQKF